jgi:hypothetical protein
MCSSATPYAHSKRVVRRQWERHVFKTGKTICTVTYGITNLGQAETSARLLETRWCGHWTIERGAHDVRDVTMGEDRNHMRTRHAPCSAMDCSPCGAVPGGHILPMLSARQERPWPRLWLLSMPPDLDGALASWLLMNLYLTM